MSNYSYGPCGVPGCREMGGPVRGYYFRLPNSLIRMEIFLRLCGAHAGRLDDYQIKPGGAHMAVKLGRFDESFAA